jgi:hypothetical protein
MFRYLVLSVCLSFECLQVFAQDSSSVIALPKQRKIHGTFYVYWGYNRDWYSKSTINFKNTTTDNYDFTLHNARASDKPDMEHFAELDQLTIPEYNLHAGYFFNDKRDLGIEISWDHLKYVVNDFQNMRVSGNIRGREIDKDTLVTPDFVHLQHTNGNNYLMVNILKKHSLFKKKNIEFSIVGKYGAGVLVSYTISTVLGSHDSGYFHYHGWVTGIATEFKLDLFKYFYISTSLQGAFAKYTHTTIGADREGRAKHHFYSLQYLYGAGFNLPFGK